MLDLAKVLCIMTTPEMVFLRIRRNRYQSILPEANLGDYLDADENLDTSNGTTEEAIVRDVLGEELSDDSDQEVNVNEEDLSIIPTRESAAAAMKILRLFLENQ